MSALAALRRIEADASAALDRAGGRPADPIVLRFLLRAYTVADRASLGAPLEAALGIAVQQYEASAAPADRPRWLALFVEVCAVADDARVREAVDRLTALLAGEWPAAADLDAAAASIDACLRAAAIVGPGPILPAAVDELERLVGEVYRPGRILESLAAHVHLASTLLTAFGLTGRIPYAMLAEELVQLARREWWNGEQNVFDAPFDVNCDAAAVLRRLAALHRDPEYIRAAVVAVAADYERDAAALVSVLASRLPLGDVSKCAGFGLTLLER